MIAFFSDQSGPLSSNLYERPFRVVGEDKLLLKSESPGVQMLSDWSRDGRYLAYTTRTSGNVFPGDDIWALPLLGGRSPVLVTATPFNETNPRFSPDGRWIAYQSDETGRFGVYIQAFSKSGAKQQVSKQPVSTRGGTAPRWSRVRRADWRSPADIPNLLHPVHRLAPRVRSHRRRGRLKSSTQIRPIKTKADHRAALMEIERLARPTAPFGPA